MRLGLRLDLLRKLCFAFHLDLKFYFFGRVGGVGGWSEKVKLKLNSTQVVVEVEARDELGKNISLSICIWQDLKLKWSKIGQ